MIRILTPEEHKNGPAIRDRYLYLMALILPFKPEEVIGTDILHVDGKEITKDNFMEISKKKPRQRTKPYIKLLIKHHLFTSPKTDDEKFEQDQLLAAKILRTASSDLFQYLYHVRGSGKRLRNVPPINREHLRKLLLSKMDAYPLVFDKIKIKTKASKNELLNHVFRYEEFARNNEAFHLLIDMNIPVCPYCNRLYTFTFSEENEEENSIAKSRAQFDHYLPKSIYPFFAVSLLNLIPSCGLCNQSKSDRLEKVLYPYSEEFGDKIVFRTDGDKNFSYLFGNKAALDDFEVVLEPTIKLDKSFQKRFENSKKEFHLLELYNGHKDYILQLYRKKHVFSDKYISSLCTEFPTLLPDEKSVKELIYSMKIDKEHWGSHSLSKLTHDIDMESL